jgi:RNA polymerase sigma-70 factor (ECF subfamily)
VTAEDASHAGDEDARLMLAVGAGDEAALRTLVEKWQGPLVNFFYRSIGSREQAEDLTQVVFVRVYKASAGYQPKAKFSTYLFHIARRLLINEYRRQQRKPLEPVDPADLGGSVEGREALSRMELEEAFAHALEQLPENQRTAILMLKQQELSYEEIAEAMDASVSAVKTWIFRARQSLRATLKEFA